MNIQGILQRYSETGGAVSPTGFQLYSSAYYPTAHYATPYSYSYASPYSYSYAAYPSYYGSVARYGYYW